MYKRLLAILAVWTLGFVTNAQIEIPYEKFELDNGLQVVVHEDHSDPVVAVYVYYHVGSGREVEGRSGFAHLFEHMMFQGSANVGDDQHFKLIQEAGGTLNGTTNRDRTMYFEVLPANQLELALWLEADRMGFLLPSMTQEKLDNQREVVKNERRQSYENRPYGLVSEVVARNLYPEGHPYSWTTIGSMADLGAASMEDISSFFRRWYGPNNATLAVGGDVDPEEVLELAEKYFGSIPRGPEVKDPSPRWAKLEQTKRVSIEDKVKLPQLTYTWPTVPMNHPDEAALDLLASVLSANKSAILDKALMIDEQLASAVSARHGAGELAGSFSITLRAERGVHLDQLEQRMFELLEQLSADGVEEERLDRLKNRYEAQLVRGLETVSSRTNRLASDNMFHGKPDFIKESMRRRMQVKPAEVRRVLERFLIGDPAVVVSVVPEGSHDQIASGRSAQQGETEKGLDRTVQPTPGPRPAVKIPEVWHSSLANGVSVVGTRFDEIPLSTFSLSIPAGHLAETTDTLGLASLTAELLGEGTQRLSGTELQDAFDGLGVTYSIRSGDYETTISVSALDKHLPKAIELVAEVVLEPRFSEEDFDRLQKERLTSLAVRADSIRSIATDVWNALMYGGGTVAGQPAAGTPDTIEALTVEDVRDFWSRHAEPSESRLVYVGKHDTQELAKLFEPLSSHWARGDARAVEASFKKPEPNFPAETRIFVVDKPGAAQSEIRIGHPGVSALDPRYHDLTILNYILGGSFSSRINLNLREDKGYTYGARSAFSGSLEAGTFTASSGVRTDVSAPSVTEFMNELTGIQEGVTEAEVSFTKDAMIQATNRQFESTRSLSRFLSQISRYGYPDDYPQQELERVEEITQEELDQLAKEYIHPDRMLILVVGDKETILESLADLPYGEPIELDTKGRPLQ